MFKRMKGEETWQINYLKINVNKTLGLYMRKNISIYEILVE